MKQIKPPRKVVRAAEDVIAQHALATILKPPSPSVEPGVKASADELRERFPHLDDATLVLFCDYIAKLATGLWLGSSSFDSADAALSALADGYTYMAVEIGYDLVTGLDQAA